LTLAPPKSGTIIRYAYLWADQHRRGREEGDKDRPALVLTLAVKADNGTVQVLVLAITHTAPGIASDAVPLPAAVKARLGMDKEPSWIVTTEANAFVWPGPDLRPIPGRRPRTVIYGRVPDNLLQQVAISFLTNRKHQISRTVLRTS